jgi:hypothetical protein
MAISLDSDIRVEQVHTDPVMFTAKNYPVWQRPECCRHAGSVKQHMLTRVRC